MQSLMGEIYDTILHKRSLMYEIKIDSKCGLCRNEKKLCKSHIHPKFFFNAVKEISPTKKFRTSDNVNTRSQDGLKFLFLCSECESKFSKYERIFKNDFFDIVKNEAKTKINTDNKDFKYFILSLLWRVGTFELYHNQNKIEDESEKFTDNEISKIKEILEKYRKLLLSENHDNIKEIKMYFLPTKKLEVVQDINNIMIDAGRIPDLLEKRFVGGSIRTMDQTDSFKECYILSFAPNCVFLINIWGSCGIDYLSGYEIGKEINISSDSMIVLDDNLTNLIWYFFTTGFIEPDSKITKESRQKIIDEVNAKKYIKSNN